MQSLNVTPFDDGDRDAWIAVGAIEPQFFIRFCEKLGITGSVASTRRDPASWPDLRRRIAEVVATRPREAWMDLLDGADCCVAPVLDLDEAPAHPQNVAREVFVRNGGVVQPAPAPRFSETPSAIQRPPPARGEHMAEALRDWGVAPEVVAALTP